MNHIGFGLPDDDRRDAGAARQRSDDGAPARADPRFGQQDVIEVGRVEFCSVEDFPLRGGEFIVGEPFIEAGEDDVGVLVDNRESGAA